MHLGTASLGELELEEIYTLWEPRSEPREPVTAQVKVVSRHQAGVGGTSVSLRGTS